MPGGRLFRGALASVAGEPVTVARIPGLPAYMNAVLKETFVTAMSNIVSFTHLVDPGVAAQAWVWLAAMPLSTVCRAKRALVSLLLKLAVSYNIALDVTFLFKARLYSRRADVDPAHCPGHRRDRLPTGALLRILLPRVRRLLSLQGSFVQSACGC